MEKKEIILKLQGPSLLPHLLRREAMYPNFAISLKQPAASPGAVFGIHHMPLFHN